MPLTEFQIAKRRLKRGRILCRHIQDHLRQTYAQYEKSHPEFAGLLLDAANYTNTLDGFLAEIHNRLMQL
ncbi:hypothetical protein ES705_41805 [subsurface metagenome]